jgi:uncharacterized membrane protein YhaH (DUF805 family)
MGNFTSLRGRLGRRPYWIAIVLLLGLRLSLSRLAQDDPSWSFLTVVSEFSDALYAPLMGRRIRDFGRSGLWGWLGLGIVELMTIALSIASGASSDSAELSSLAAGLINFTPLFLLIGFVGMIKGDPGPNRYGPASAGSASQPKQPASGDDEDPARADAIIARALAARSAAAARPRSGSALIAIAPNQTPSGPPVFGKRRWRGHQE